MNLFALGIVEIGVSLLFVVITVCIVLWLINSRYPSILYKVTRANLGQAASGIEAANAVNLMKQSIQDCTEQIQNAKSGLIKALASIKGLERQVTSGSSEEARLVARIQSAIASGKTDEDAVLRQTAASLKRVRDDLKVNRDQLQAQHGIYNDLLSQIQSAQRRAETLEREANSLGAQLETSKLTAELADFANTFDAKNVTASLDGVSKYSELIRRQIDENTAKMKVNKDLGGTTSNQFNQDEDVSEILADFRKA